MKVSTIMSKILLSAILSGIFFTTYADNSTATTESQNIVSAAPKIESSMPSSLNSNAPPTKTVNKIATTDKTKFRLIGVVRIFQSLYRGPSLKHIKAS